MDKEEQAVIKHFKLEQQEEWLAELKASGVVVIR